MDLYEIAVEIASKVDPIRNADSWRINLQHEIEEALEKALGGCRPVRRRNGAAQRPCLRRINEDSRPREGGSVSDYEPFYRPFTDDEIKRMRRWAGELRDGFYDTSRWLATLAAKDAELERVRGLLRQINDAPNFHAYMGEAIRRKVAAAVDAPPPPDTAEAGEVVGA